MVLFKEPEKEAAMNPIKKAMIEQGIGFNELQEKTKISKSTLSPLVNSEKIPTKTKIETLERVSIVLNTSIVTLLDNENFLLNEFKLFEVKSFDNEYQLKYSYKDCSFCLLVEIFPSTYENRADYFIDCSIIEYKNIVTDDLLLMFKKLTYDELSIFLENSLNILELKLLGQSSSVIIEFIIPLENELFLGTTRISLYTIKTNTFDLPRKKGDSLVTTRRKHHNN